MKVFIGTDMEGVNGVVTREHTHRHGREHDRARGWLTDEVNAAVEGAIAAGATFITVEDGHGTCRNILPDKLHPKARLITGQDSSLPPSMVHGLDADYDAMVLVGYHAMAGTPQAILDHTNWSQTVRRVRVNGTEVGEASVMGAFAGAHGVPLVFVSGDDKLGSQIAAMHPSAVRVVVKKALGRYVCEMLPIEESLSLIRAGVEQGVRRAHEIEPFRFSTPTTLELEFLHPVFADLAELVPLTERTGDERVAFTSDDYIHVFRAFSAMCATSAIALQANQ